MHQPALALEPKAALQALELPVREVQGASALGIRDLLRQSGLDQPRSGDFLSAHREGLHSGTTFSLSR
jgi:hypothetical protein